MSAAQTLGKFEIRRQLGRGAMGTVYEGWDPVIKRPVAIKTVRLPKTPIDDTIDEISRFRREAEAAGRLTHPNIVGVFDYGETADLAYIVMEYVDGPTLKSLLDDHERFSLPRITRLMDDLLAGLQFSHERGVVHRDIKPANLMLTKAGQTKIADFGIARIETASITQAGTVLGTPAYMSPEQFMGLVADARSDIYSSGVLLYQLLTGERPFDGAMASIMHKALNLEAPPPSQISLTAPRQFDAVIQRALAKRPDDRYATAAEFAAAIRDAATPRTPSPDRVKPDATDEATVIASPRSLLSARAGAGIAPPGVALAGGARAGGARAGGALAGAAIPAAANAGKGRKSRGVGFAVAGAGLASATIVAGVAWFLMSGPSSLPGSSSAPPPAVVALVPPPVVPPSAPPATVVPPSVPPASVTVAPPPSVPGAEPAPPPVVERPPEPIVPPRVAIAPPPQQPPPGVAPVDNPPPGNPPPAAPVLAPVPLPPVVPPAVVPPPVVPPPVVPPVVVPPAVVPPPVVPPPVVPPAVVSPTVVPAIVAPPPPVRTPLERVREAARAVPCSVLKVISEQNDLNVSGVAAGGPELDQLLANAREAGGVTDAITRADRSVCPAIATVAALTRQNWEAERRAFVLTVDRKDLVSGGRLGTEIASPWPVIYLDYYRDDGLVHHLVRPGAAGSNGDPRRASVALPGPGSGLLVAIGAAAPLEGGKRPEKEKASVYLAALQTWLRDAATPLDVDLTMVTVRPAPAVVPPVVPPVVNIRPPEPVVPKPRPTQPAVVKESLPRPPALHSGKCSNILSRAQLGETLSNAEIVALRTECRS